VGIAPLGHYAVQIDAITTDISHDVGEGSYRCDDLEFMVALGCACAIAARQENGHCEDEY
jgi:hypothetical protein